MNTYKLLTILALPAIIVGTYQIASLRNYVKTSAKQADYSFIEVDSVVFPALPSKKANISFDSLNPCEQLDAVAKAGKSVSDYIVSSSNYWLYANNVKSFCPWHEEQTKTAHGIIYPRVQQVAPKLRITIDVERVKNAQKIEQLCLSSPSNHWKGDHCMSTEETNDKPTEEKTMAEISPWAFSENPENANKTHSQIEAEQQAKQEQEQQDTLPAAPETPQTQKGQLKTNPITGQQYYDLIWRG